MAILLKKAKRSTLPILLALAMSCAMLPAPAFAEAADGGSGHSLSVMDVSGNSPPFIDGAWNLTSGTYTVSGTAQQHSEGLRIAGDVVLSLDGVTIDHSAIDTNRHSDIAQYAPAISIESGNVQMSLSGASTVEGSPGYAGIYVAEGATLTISGSGSLTATGGNACASPFSSAGVPLPPDKFGENQSGFFSGGAGIGGNGIWVQRASGTGYWKEIPGYSPNFGTVQIKGGTVNATGGGMMDQANLGAGAGIGAGGNSGGPTGQRECAASSDSFRGSVRIDGGIVAAMGGGSQNWSKTGGGAGVGTGGVTGEWYYYHNDLSIQINGGKVTATGSGDGAGIGGGANIGSGTIEITDGFVTAIGGDEGPGKTWGGAGIGGGDGDFNYVWLISISGGTVNATGAGDAAGIGAGHDGMQWGTISFSGSAVVEAHGGSGKNGGSGIYANEISLADQANVRAYANGRAQGIVSGPGAGLQLSDTAALWVQTQDASKPALPGGTNGPGQALGGISYSSSTTYLVTNYNYRPPGTTEADTAYGWLNVPSASFEGDKTFGYAWSDAGLLIDGNLAPFSAGAAPTGGSWATLYSEPVIATYRVEHYQEQLDGTYSLAETDFPLYGEVGTIVEATVNDYEHYHLNDAMSTLSGKVVPLAEESGEEKMLTLKAYYDLDIVTLSYDLNHGVGVEGVDYGPEDARYGASLIVKPAPVREGYAFLGWSDGENMHEPDDAIVLAADTMLVATWEENPPNPPDEDPAVPPDDGPVAPSDGEDLPAASGNDGSQTGSQTASGQDGEDSTKLARTGDGHAIFRNLLATLLAICGNALVLIAAARRSRANVR